MPIEIRIVDGEACPVIVCDVTGEVIRDAAMANAVWSEAEGPKKGQVFFVKKGHEPAGFKQRLEAWYDLPLFLFWLGKNVGYAESSASDKADRHPCDGTLPT